MCLFYDKSFSTRIRNRIVKNGKKITCYKVLRVIGNTLESPYFGEEYKPGWNVSDRCEIAQGAKEQEYHEVYKGIHVFTSKKVAKEDVLNGRIVVPVTCYAKDFVGAGCCEAVFMKVFLSRKDYDKALKGSK